MRTIFGLATASFLSLVGCADVPNNGTAPTINLENYWVIGAYRFSDDGTNQCLTPLPANQDIQSGDIPLVSFSESDPAAAVLIANARERGWPEVSVKEGQVSFMATDDPVVRAILEASQDIGALPTRPACQTVEL